MSGSEVVRQGDFWALMFFVVALANFFLHFALGWCANIIIQVSAFALHRTNRYKWPALTISCRG